MPDSQATFRSDLRAKFSAAMSKMYRAEEPAYGVLVDLVEGVNAAVVACAVEEYGGSFSAEHGIGPKNRRYFEKYMSAGVQAMGSVLRAGLFVRPPAAG